MIEDLRGIRTAVDAMDERLARISGSGNASITINGSCAMAIAGLWVSAPLLVIAAALSFVAWQQAQSVDRQMTELRTRVDMAEGRAALTDAKLRRLEK